MIIGRVHHNRYNNIGEFQLKLATSFKYLDSSIHEQGTVEEEITNQYVGCIKNQTNVLETQTCTFVVALTGDLELEFRTEC